MLGGGEHSFLDLLSHLSPILDPIAVIPGEGDLSSRLQKRKIKTQIIPMPALRPWLILKILSSVKDFYYVFRRYRPDLIYANGSRAAFYGGIIGRTLGLPIVWHCRITEPDSFLDFILTRLCDRIVVNSQATSKRFDARFQKKITVIYNGLDLQWLKEDIVNKPDQIENWKIVLVVARVSQWKRHDTVLSAFTKVAKSDPKAHLVCLGAEDPLEPEWWKHLQDKTKSSTFSDRIHWTGHVDDVRPWYRVAHMLVLASENEPFGRVLVEAMACGVPVIATSSGGIPEIVRNGQEGLLVKPGSAQTMSDAIMKILQDDALRKRLSESAVKRAESFNIIKHTSEMLHTFETLLSFN
jgi:glycosyltransferase involved in cell wall biosynthesis